MCVVPMRRVPRSRPCISAISALLSSTSRDAASVTKLDLARFRQSDPTTDTVEKWAALFFFELLNVTGKG
jgi:hypothetical protein